MKKLLLLLSIVLVTGGLSAKNLIAYFDYKTFYSPEEGGILETYMNFDGTSVSYATTESGQVQAKLEVVVIITNGDKEIVNYGKKEVYSPLINDLEYVNFLDQSRFLLPNGPYNVEVKIKDLNAPVENIYSFEKSIRIDSKEKSPFFSDIELLSGYRNAKEDSPLAKSGLDLLPYLSNFYSSDFSEMMFYVEVYNIDKKIDLDQPLLLIYAIEDPSNKSIVGNYRKFTKVTSAPVISYLGTFNLDELYSGTYNLIVEVRDSENKLIENTKTKIIRQKTNLNMTYGEEDINKTFAGFLDNRDSLSYFIKSLAPISNSSELAAVVNTKELDILRLKSYFYSFWSSRNAENPEAEWEGFQKKVKYVNEEFGTQIKMGFETDMGRVYLKYGAPTSVYAERQPEDVWPFQIWHYRDSNHKFVFYSPSAVQTEYIILHTNVKDEQRNPRWISELYGYRGTNNTYEDLNMLKNDNRFKELYNNPR